MTEPFVRPAPQPGDRELAVYLHENACQDESCEGWERVSSFGKAGWLDLAREVIAMVEASRTATRQSAGAGLDVELLASTDAALAKLTLDVHYDRLHNDIIRRLDDIRGPILARLALRLPAEGNPDAD